MVRLLAFLLGLLTAASTALAEPSIVDIRIGVHADKTRFVVELDEAPTYRAFTLPDPFRVVIDLPALDWSRAENGLPAGGGVIEALRFGLFAPGTSRMVLDVKAPVAIQKLFVIPGGDDFRHRLVIDLVEVSRQAYFAQPREPILSQIPLPRPEVATPPAPPRSDADDRPLVVLDPGHGGVDPGAIGVTGIYEKTLVMAYAHALKRQIEATGRYRVALTRDKDVFIRLRDRVMRAQETEAELFLSLHANTHPKPDLRGAAVYSLSETASDAEAAALAAKENKADVIAGIDLSDQTEVVSMILIDLAQRETMNQSKKFAGMLVGELSGVGQVLRNGHRSAGFAVLKSPTVPSVLIEIGYMSNKKEERLLRSEEHQHKVAEAIIRAVDEYFVWQQSARR
jgi:N-acetylmuramoyl-L-alanine amidase